MTAANKLQRGRQEPEQSLAMAAVLGCDNHFFTPALHVW